MSIAELLGLTWILIAGITQGAFPMPMKYARAWKWEHLWFWYSAIAFFVLPLVVALATVPDLGQVFSASPGTQIVLTAVFGLAWGAGSVFFGLGIDALGMALGFPLMTGLYTALGALIPLAILTPELLLQRSGLFIIAGNVVTIAGVSLCAVAGNWRDKQSGSPMVKTIGPGRSFPVALALCILAGILSAMFNFGYAFGSEIMNAAVARGASKENAPNAVWLVMIPAGGLINVAYCLHLVCKNRSWKLLARQSTVVDWVNAWLMALLWTGSVIIYGWGASYLGVLGPTLGWSLWNAILIATTLACGLATHEWNGVRGRSLYLLFTGIGVLVAAVFVLGMGL